MSQDTKILAQLWDVIKQRAASASPESYTHKLLEGGTSVCARKLAEEAIETVVAALEKDSEGVVQESADLLYHWLVLLKAAKISPETVYAELRRRLKD